MVIRRIISGGQTGADEGGLCAAKLLNIETSGWMPKGFKRLDGQHPEFAQLYNLREHLSSYYPPRTYANVRDSHGTIRIASTFQSSGELCTLKAIKHYNRPYFDIPRNHPPEITIFQQWIKTNKIRILNVAGNSENTSPGIKEFTIDYLKKALDF